MFAAAAVVLGLVVLEAGLRLLPRGREPYEDFYEGIYDVGYGMVPGALNPFSEIREQLNRYGFRGADIPEEKPAGEFRILCLGDSCTFGVKVALEESYPAQLGRFLSERLPDARIVVINGGIPGTNFFQHLIALERKLVRFSPDLVVIWSGPNFNEPIKLFRERMKDPPFYLVLQRPLRHLAIYQVIQRKLKRGPFEKAYFEMLDERLAETAGAPKAPERFTADEYLRDYAEDLEHLRALALAHRFEPVLTNYPSQRTVLHPSYKPPPFYNNLNGPLLSAFCERYGYLQIDLIAPQQGVADESYFLDSVHPSPRGYALIARTIGERLIEAGKIPGGR